MFIRNGEILKSIDPSRSCFAFLCEDGEVHGIYTCGNMVGENKPISREHHPHHHHHLIETKEMSSLTSIPDKLKETVSPLRKLSMNL